MATISSTSVPVGNGNNSIRIRLLDVLGETRLDIRRYDHAAPSNLGVSVDVRHLPAIRAAIEEAEAEARKLDLLTDGEP